MSSKLTKNRAVLEGLEGFSTGSLSAKIMNIESNDKTTLLEIIKNDPSDVHSSFTMRVQATSFGDDKFLAENTNVVFPVSDSLCTKISDFFNGEIESVLINATEDCYLNLYSVGSRKQVAIEFSIVKYMLQDHPMKNTPLKTSGVLVINNEYKNKLSNELCAICSA
jgi:hypothetical protein